MIDQYRRRIDDLEDRLLIEKGLVTILRGDAERYKSAANRTLNAAKLPDKKRYVVADYVNEALVVDTWGRGNGFGAVLASFTGDDRIERATLRCEEANERNEQSMLDCPEAYA